MDLCNMNRQPPTARSLNPASPGRVNMTTLSFYPLQHMFTKIDPFDNLSAMLYARWCMGKKVQLYIAIHPQTNEPISLIQRKNGKHMPGNILPYFHNFIEYLILSQLS